MDNTNKNLDAMPKKSPLSFQIDLKKFEKATDEEKRQQDVMSESTSFLKDGLRKLSKNPLAMGSIVVLILIIGMIFIVPHVVPYSYSQIITVNGRRDKTAANMAPFEYSDLEQKYIEEGERYSLTLWEQTKWDVITLYVLYTEQEYPLQLVFSQVSSFFYRSFVRKYFRLFWRQGRPCNDAYRGYYIFTSGYAYGNSFIRRSPRGSERG